MFLNLLLKLFYRFFSKGNQKEMGQSLSAHNLVQYSPRKQGRLSRSGPGNDEEIILCVSDIVSLPLLSPKSLIFLHASQFQKNRAPQKTIPCLTSSLLRLHGKMQSHAFQLVQNLIQRLPAHVSYFHEIIHTLRTKVFHGIDSCTLQTVI